MANQLLTFMEADDEKAFLRFLERFTFEVYPRRVPPDWKPFRATAAALPDFPREDVYLVASDIGPALVDRIKRGPDKGSWRVDEVRSPVIFWERCLVNDDGELLSGELWAELDVTSQTGRRNAAPDQFRARFLEVEAWLRKQFRKSNPKGYLIGPATARRVKEGSLKLRENKHWGREIAVH
ncbi:MAG: hypothetical protein AB1938_09935 [Myxococcota bacterium]